MDWNYPINIPPFEYKNEMNDQILIGNSGSIFNNHIDIFNLIKKFVKNQKIIVPLSYGGDSCYVEEVCTVGDKYFGKNFVSILNFLPDPLYVEILKKCDIAIINSKRQMAYGNIAILISFGTKIFLDKENPLYEFLKSKGIFIYSLDEMSVYNLSSKLSLINALNNYEIISKLLSNNVIDLKTKQIGDSLLS